MCSDPKNKNFRGGLGCNANGVNQNCRFCAFPGVQTDKPFYPCPFDAPPPAVAPPRAPALKAGSPRPHHTSVPPPAMQRAEPTPAARTDAVAVVETGTAASAATPLVVVAIVLAAIVFAIFRRLRRSGGSTAPREVFPPLERDFGEPPPGSHGIALANAFGSAVADAVDARPTRASGVVAGQQQQQRNVLIDGF